MVNALFNFHAQQKVELKLKTILKRYMGNSVRI